MDELKITFESHGKKYTATMSDSAELDEIYNAVNAMLIGITFSQAQIDNHILNLADDIKIDS
jgi:hypothetical protein